MGVFAAAVVVWLIQSKDTVMGFLIFYSKTPNQNVKHQCVETLRFMFTFQRFCVRYIIKNSPIMYYTEYKNEVQTSIMYDFTTKFIYEVIFLDTQVCKLG